MNNDNETTRPDSSGTIIRAQNGDILRYDATGMVMVLSDRVIADIDRRLPGLTALRGNAEWIDPLCLGDIDAWDLRRDGEWLLFGANLPGAQGPRQFRRLAESDSAEIDPGIIADGAGPLRGLFSLGGARRATGFDAPLDYPWHVLAPADDLGAVGHAGEKAQHCSALEDLRETTRDAAVADVLAGRQHRSHKAMSLFVTRCETDSSASISELAESQAYANLMTAIENLKACADRLGRPATLYGLAVEFVLEDVCSTSAQYRDGVFALLAQLTCDIARAGLRRPPVVAVFDCGTHRLNDSPVLRAQWDLAWQGPEHGLNYSAPGYMFKQDPFARPDTEALWQMAEMDACALEALHAGEDWFCPIFLLAEREPDPAQIRVRARSMGDLVLDPRDPFGAGAHFGFSLTGTTNHAALIGVTIADDDPQDIILAFDMPPEGERLEVLYAFGMTVPRKGTDFPMACGAVRDQWGHDSKTGSTLHRWALPAALPVW
ncbi:MAG: hypothetical protein AAF999_10310 [Pseudomonadota bacterium]